MAHLGLSLWLPHYMIYPDLRMDKSAGSPKVGRRTRPVRHYERLPAAVAGLHFIACLSLHQAILALRPSL